MLLGNIWKSVKTFLGFFKKRCSIDEGKSGRNMLYRNDIKMIGR